MALGAGFGHWCSARQGLRSCRFHTLLHQTLGGRGARAAGLGVGSWGGIRAADTMGRGVLRLSLWLAARLDSARITGCGQLAWEGCDRRLLQCRREGIGCNPPHRHAHTKRPC